MSIINIANVSFVRNKNSILNDINWHINANENWIILGPNGSGKSTLVSLLTGYEWPTTGTVTVKGYEYGNCTIREIRKKIGLFEPSLSDQIIMHHPSITALEVICTGIFSTIGVYDEFSGSTIERAKYLIKNTFMSSGFHIDENRLFNNLSSGEKRKILFLRILISEPELIIFDEPYESLDIPSRAMLEGIFLKFFDITKTPNITILHRIEEIPLYATHVIMLKNGKIFKSGPLDELINSRNLSELYETDLIIEKHSQRFVCIIQLP